MTRLATHLLLALFLVLCGHTSTAEAIIIHVELTPELDEVDVPVIYGRATSLYFPGPVRDWQNGNKRDYKVDLAVDRTDTLNINLKTKHPIPSNLNIELWDGRRVTVRFYLVSKVIKSASRVEFCEPGTMPCMARAITRQDQGIGAWVAEAHQVDQPTELTWSHLGYGLILTTGYSMHSGSSVMLSVRLVGNGDTPYPVADLQLRDHLERRIDASIVFGDVPGEEGVELKRGQELGLVFHVADRHQIEMGWTVLAIPTGRVVPAKFGWRPTKRQKGPLEGRMVLVMRAYGGAGNLDDGVGNGKNLWTQLQGFGGRVTYGVARHISIAATLDVTRSNAATFAGASWEQDQGDLLISETAGRVSAGAMFHTAGKRWLPYANVALGVRLSRRDLSMGSRDGSEFRSSALLGLGGGLNVLLGKRWLAGLSMDYAAPLGGNDTAQTFELGVHLGAIWDLVRNR